MDTAVKLYKPALVASQQAEMLMFGVERHSLLFHNIGTAKWTAVPGQLLSGGFQLSLQLSQIGLADAPLKFRLVSLRVDVRTHH